MLLVVIQIASANSRSAMRGASHQSDFISCLTISDTRLPCLPSTQVNPCVPGVIEGSEDVDLFHFS